MDNIMWYQVTVELRLRDAFRSDLWKGLANTNVDRDNSVSTGRMTSSNYDISVFWYQVYQARPKTRRTGLASLVIHAAPGWATIPTLFLVSPDKLDIKRH